jgi:hypothetical protein
MFLLGSVPWSMLAALDHENTLSSKFVMEVQVLDALEGGPLVLKVGVAYRVKDPINIRYPARSRVGLIVPNSWELGHRRRIFVYIGPVDIRRRLERGDKLEAILFLHQDYADIPAGKALLKVNWLLLRADEQYGVVANPSVSVTIDVPRACQERLSIVGETMAKQCGADNLPSDEAAYLTKKILGTKHEAFTPAVFKLLAVQDLDAGMTYQLISWLYSRCGQPEKCTAELVSLVCQRNSRAGLGVFDYWRSEKTNLSAYDVQRLMRSRNLWTKMSTYGTFPERCEKEWRDAILSELRNLDRALPGSDIGRLLVSLEDRQFRVRENASQELINLGVLAEPAVRARLEKAISPEARRRLQGILTIVSSEKSRRYPSKVLAEFGAGRTAEYRELLEALEAGRQDAWLTKEAKAVLRRRSSVFRCDHEAVREPGERRTQSRAPGSGRRLGGRSAWFGRAATVRARSS